MFLLRTQHDSPDITVRATFFSQYSRVSSSNPCEKKALSAATPCVFHSLTIRIWFSARISSRIPIALSFRLFVSGDFAVCENHRDDQIDAEVIQHHIAEPFHTASRRLPETVMSRPVFRSGGRKDLPDVALRFAIYQTGEKNSPETSSAASSAIRNTGF